MDLLSQIVTVELTLGTTPSQLRNETSSSSDADTVLIPRQPLRGKLVITYDNTGGADTAKEAAATAFLSRVGEPTLQSAWHHLLSRLTLVPFLLDRADTDVVDDSPQSPSSPGPDGDVEDGRQGQTDVDLPRLSSCWDSRRFLFGVPTFWREKLYISVSDNDDEADSDEERPHTGTAGGHKAHVTTSAAAAHEEGDDNSWRRLPCRTAGEALEVTAGAGKTTVMGGGDGPVPASIVSEYDFEFTAPEVAETYIGQPSALAFAVLLSPLEDPLPQQLPQCPNGEVDATSDAGATEEKAPPSGAAAGQGGAADDWTPFQRYVALRVLARDLFKSYQGGAGGGGGGGAYGGGSSLASLYGVHTVLLGCHYTPVRVTRALACQSVTCPLSNDQLLLNLNITNASNCPVVLHSASFDVYSTTTANSRGRSRQRRERRQELWAEQRAGPTGADMRVIDLLTKVVTVTPMIVSNDRPPFTLQAGETYSFQFIIGVLPQLCYLLNPKSLQYIYARYAQRSGGAASQAAAGGPLDPANGRTAEEGGGRGERVTSPTTLASRGGGAEAVILDCYGKAVSNEEIVSVLSTTFVSYLFVFFDVMRGDEEDMMPAVSVTTAPAAGGTAAIKADGLHLRHAAPWSFAAQ